MKILSKCPGHLSKGILSSKENEEKSFFISFLTILLISCVSSNNVCILSRNWVIFSELFGSPKTVLSSLFKLSNLNIFVW